MQKIKYLILGISGGIAAYKSAELVRLLIKQGMEVQVIMTESACQFITPTTMQALSGKPVFSNLWEGGAISGMAHIELSRKADAILIAPASADFLAKLAHGSADDLLSSICLARDCPLMIAPAMNKQMWENPATQRNILQLQQDGLHILGPNSGEQACGEIGYGRMLEPEQLLSAIEAFQQPKCLKNKRVLITAGPTVEAIDPVRAITNFSSGKMGYSIAQAAIEMGAEVTLVSGPTALTPPITAKTIKIVSAQEMLTAVMNHINHQDIFIAVAAVADYRPISPNAKKIKKTKQNMTLELVENTDILATVSGLSNPPFCVGFAAESDHLLEYAEEKRLRKKLPLIAANLVSEAMGKDTSALVLLDNNGSHPLPHTSKIELARLLLQHIAGMLNKS